MMRPATWKLKAWRDERSLTQAQAALLIGTNKRQWLLMERGRTIPNHDNMVRLFVVTEGSVRPDDFYALPILPALKRAA